MTTVTPPAPARTDEVSAAVINAALWLREQVGYKQLASLSLTFREEPITVTYSAAGFATVAVEGDDPVGLVLTDADLDSERWTT